MAVKKFELFQDLITYKENIQFLKLIVILMGFNFCISTHSLLNKLVADMSATEQSYIIRLPILQS